MKGYLGDKMKNKSTWILVEVRSGIPVSARAFPSELLAKAEETKLRKSLNLEKDETAIFQVDIQKEKRYDQPAKNR
jgi:hypothetical protein